MPVHVCFDAHISAGHKNSCCMTSGERTSNDIYFQRENDKAHGIQSIYHFKETATALVKTAATEASATQQQQWVVQLQVGASDTHISDEANINLPHTVHHWHCFACALFWPIRFSFFSSYSAQRYFVLAQCFPFTAICPKIHVPNERLLSCWVRTCRWCCIDFDLNSVSLHLEFGANRREETIFVCSNKSQQQRMCVHIT